MKRTIESKKRILTLIMAAILCGSMLLFYSCKNDDIPDDRNIEEVVTETTPKETVETPDSKGSGDNENERKDDDDTKGDAAKAGDTKSGGTKQDRGINMDEAINIALARVPGATRSHLVHIEKDSDDGRVSYEGEIYYNGVEYEFAIDASNGNILEWEIDD